MRFSLLYYSILVGLIAGCSDYQINPGEALQTTAQSGETATLDTETQTTTVALDDPPVTIHEMDPPSTYVDLPPLKKEYCTPFDHFKDWSYIGDGDWNVQGGQLYESRGGLYGSVAYLTKDDFKKVMRWRIEVSTAFEGSLNDMAGIVFNIDPATRNFNIIRWDDPNNAYQRHMPPGSIDVLTCTDKKCVVDRSYESINLMHPADGTFKDWSVEVIGNMLTVVWGGNVVVQDTIPELFQTGPGVVGLYSNDNDGGIIYDDFCIWVAKP